jgi:hypothetical protein
MRGYRMLIAAAVLFAAATPLYAPAQVESTPVPTPSRPNFAPLEFLIGTWSCSTKSARRPSAYLTSVTYAMDPSGWWIDETSVTSPTKWISSKLTTYDKITYDSTTHRWVDLDYGPANGYSLAFTSGWSGNKLVWHDVSFAPTSDISSQTDNTMVKVSATKLTSSSSFTEAKTGRVVAVAGVCTKH